MNLKQLEYFIAIADNKNFSLASKKLFVSQPNVSKSIRQLEHELGVELFDRYPRKVVLNKYGKFFYREIKDILNKLEKSKSAIKEMVDPDSGVINLSFIHSLGDTLIPEIISEYKRLFPNIKFNLYQGSTDVLLKNLLEGESDFCFLMDRKFPEKIKYRKIFSEKLYAILPYNHPLKEVKYIDLKTLKDEPFISFKLGIGLRNSIDLICQKAGFHPKVTFECQEVSTVAGLVESGLGVSLIPKLKGIDRYNVKIVPLINQVQTRNINLAVKESSFVPPSIKNFHLFLNDKFNIKSTLF